MPKKKNVQMDDSRPLEAAGTEADEWNLGTPEWAQQDTGHEVRFSNHPGIEENAEEDALGITLRTEGSWE